MVCNIFVLRIILRFAKSIGGKSDKFHEREGAMKPDIDTWMWCRRNGVRYIECEHATGRIVHFWKSRNVARMRHTRKDTYICSTGRYLAILYDKFKEK